MNNLTFNYLPLYLKYRPQKLSELVGQSFISQTLTNAINNNRLSHAYLFTGPRGTGKTSTARILAKSVNCKNGPTENPCNECSRCIDIKSGTSTAVIELDAASNNSVDDARLLIEKAPLSVMGGNVKFYIIDECHMLSKEAFNALLKTIEEPPPSVIFVLATTEEQKVPQTILSRCQKLSFKFIDQADLIMHLKKINEIEKFNLGESAINLIARRAQGGLRDALSMLDQASLLSIDNDKTALVENDLIKIFGVLSEDILLRISQLINQQNSRELLALIEDILKDGREPSVIITELTKHFLNLAKAYSFKPGESEILNGLILGSSEYITSLIIQSKEFDYNYLMHLTHSLSNLEQDLKRAPSQTIFLEIKLLTLANRIDYVTTQDLLDRITTLENIIASENYSVKPSVIPPSNNKKPRNEINNIIEESPLNSVNSKEEENLSQVNSTSITISNYPSSGENAANIVSESYSNDNLLQETIDDEPNNTTETVQQTESDFWSNLLTELQKRHLPTYSLILSNASLISISELDLTIGVTSPTFQKMLESKQQYITDASNNILGRKLSLKIKIQDKKKSHSPSDNEVSVQTKASKLNVSQVNNTSEESCENSSFKQPLTGDENTDLIKQAYNLFEGPGSKLIG